MDGASTQEVNSSCPLPKNNKMDTTQEITKEELFAEISRNGINVDVEGLARQKSKLQNDELETLDALDEFVDFPALRRQYPDAFAFKKRETPRFNPRSRKHLGAWFMSRGEDLPHAFSMEVLEPRLPPEMFDLVVKARRLRKNWGDLQTLRDHVQIDGKIHVEWSEAATGRWYTGSPAIQTMSKICRQFLVPDEGNGFWIIDWQQQELRILAHLSQEPVMLGWFEDDHDPHEGAFELVTGNDLSDGSWSADQYKEARDLGKMLNYALIYGLDAQGLGNRLRIGNDKAQLLINAYFKRLPALASWRQYQKQIVREAGYVETMGGRKIPVELETDRRDAEERLARKAVNYKIQGSAAEQLINALRNVHSMGLLSHVRATIHDALLIETSPGSESVASSIAGAMRIPFMGVENPVDVKGPAATWMEGMDLVETLEPDTHEG